MRVTMELVVEGLPERIEEAADTLDRAFTGAIDWSAVAKLGRDHTMRIKGFALLHHEALRALGRIKLFSSIAQPRKLIPTAAQGGDQFCAPQCRLQP